MILLSGSPKRSFPFRYLVFVILVTAGVVLCLGLMPVGHAQIRAIKTDLSPWLIPAPPALGPRGSVTADPDTGVPILRATDATDGQYLGTHYVYWPTFNKDNTRLYVKSDSGQAFILNFDPVNFRIGTKEEIPPIPGVGYGIFEGATWSATDPNVLFFVANAALYDYHVDTKTWTLVADLGQQFPGEYFWQPSFSSDGNRTGWTRKKFADYSIPGYAVYDRTQQRVILKVDANNFDELTLSQSGRFVLAKNQNAPSAGAIESTVHDLDAGTKIDLIDDTDAAPGHGDAGWDSYVGYDNFNNRMTWRSLTAPKQFVVIQQFPAWNVGANHTSMRSIDGSWALTGFDGGSNDGVPFRCEVVQFATDGSGGLRRLFHHFSVYTNYYDSTRANISRDGQFVAFTSNWGGQARTDLFVAKIAPEGSNPTPTPTPNPSPTASPSPSPSPNTPPTVGVTSPTGGTTFGTGTNIAINTSASDPDGSVARVDFYQNGVLIGADTSSPYGVVWSNAPNGTYTLTARATDSLGATNTSSGVAISVKNSPGSVGRAKGHGHNLLSGMTSTSTSTYAGAADPPISTLVTAADLDSLAADIAAAYGDFIAERSFFGLTADRIDKHLQAALYFTKADSALATRLGPATSVRNHLQRVVAHLAMTEDLMLYRSISAATAIEANAANARVDVTVGPATTGYGITPTTRVAPRSLSSVFANSTLSPLSTQALFATPAADRTFPYELGGVNVTVAGKAVPVIYVSPTRISFYVAPDVALGTSEVLVTSQTGYISRGTITIGPNIFRLITASEVEVAALVAINAAKGTGTSFGVTTTENFGPDKRTRLLIFATGLSGSATNTNAANDVTIGGVVQPNFAEAVIVEARRSNGTIVRLPIEFAGAQGLLPGLDQINVILPSQLAGAGTVRLTLIINSQRSNTPTIQIQ